MQGDCLVVILAELPRSTRQPTRSSATSATDPSRRAPGDDLASAYVSARAALSGLRAAVGWPDAPRPVATDDLLPERVLAGDGHARRHLVEEVFPAATGQFRPGEHADRDAHGVLPARPVPGGDGASPLRTPQHGALPAAKAADVTGLSATDAREALTLQLALALGRQARLPADD